MWYKVLPWLFIFHSSLMDSLRKYFREHGKGLVVHADKHPLDWNTYYKVAKVEDLSSSSFVLWSVFAEFGGHALEQKQFAMATDKICFTVRRNLHWNTLLARLCHVHCWRASCKKFWDTDGLTWNRRMGERSSECLPTWVTVWLFESEFPLWGNILEANLL